MEGGHVHRGSQRALKMLNAQMQKTNNSQAAALKPAPRMAWPPRPNVVTSLDPPPEVSRAPSTLNPTQAVFRHSVPSVSSSSSSFGNDQHARNTVTTPIATHREPHAYASPEANFPSNGGPVMETRDADQSRTSCFGESSGLLVHDFNNNSNTGFSAPSGSQVNAAAPAELPAQILERHTFVQHASESRSFSLDNEDETRSSMCFSLGDGKVTSIVATPDGAYCIAGFSSGAIRLFDMTKEGNTDPEDRFGYQIGMIESSRGSVQVQLELGCALAGSPNCSVDCCHLFAGARQGSTTMLVVDIGFLREVHKKRGFISVAGGGVQTLTHSDARLKGMTALTTVASTRPSAAAVVSSAGHQQLPPVGRSAILPSSTAAGAGAGAAAPPSRGYVATYRLISGRGFGQYHLWEVTLDARAAVYQAGSPLAGSNSSSSGGSGGLVYKQSWRHLYQGAVNGPTMNFAHFVEKPLSLAVPTGACGIPSARLSLWEQLQQRGRLDQGSGGGVPALPSGCEVIVSETQKDIRVVALNVSGDARSIGESNAVTAAGKPATLKETTATYACAQDGRVLFGGKYELVVSVLESTASRHSESPGPWATQGSNSSASSSNHPAGSGGNHSDTDDSAASATRISHRAVFSLSDFAPGVVGKSTKKSSRHLREVSDVWCTPDGAYALILCTDNAVLLYSVCDISGKGSFPTRTEGGTGFYRSADGTAGGGSGGGFLTFLFEADDAFSLDLGIAYAFSDSERLERSCSTGYGGCKACACGIQADWAAPRGPQQHLAAENVLVCISWWLIENPMLAGVMKVCRLKVPVQAAASTVVVGGRARSVGPVSDLFDQLIPAGIATSTIVLDAASSSSRGNKAIASAASSCALCSDPTVKHWADDALTSAEVSLCCLDRSAMLDAAAGAGKLSGEASSKAADARDKRPPVGKKREVRKEVETALSTATKPAVAAKDKRQKVAHFPCAEEGSGDRRLSDASSTAGAAENDYYFTSYDSDTQLSKETSRVEAVEQESEMEASGRDSLGSRDEAPEADSASQLERTQSVDGLDDDASVPPITGRGRSGRESPAEVIASAREETSSNVSNIPSGRRSRVAAANTISSGGAGSSTMAVQQQLRQEVERMKAENRRLRVDTDLTMRKADRRFELEMEARRFWKREKAELEGVISGLQKDQQRWMAEKEKLRRLHELVQSVMYTASCTLESSLEFPAALPAGAQAVAFSPAAQLRSELTAVGKGEVTTTFATRNGAVSGGASGGSSSSSATGTKRVQFFCIVCLEHTARVAIQPCGHICFCVLHAEEMQQRQHDHHYNKCPLCQAKINGFLTLQGVDV